MEIIGVMVVDIPVIPLGILLQGNKQWGVYNIDIVSGNQNKTINIPLSINSLLYVNAIYHSEYGHGNPTGKCTLTNNKLTFSIDPPYTGITGSVTLDVLVIGK